MTLKFVKQLPHGIINCGYSCWWCKFFCETNLLTIYCLGMSFLQVAQV